MLRRLRVLLEFLYCDLDFVAERPHEMCMNRRAAMLLAEALFNRLEIINVLVALLNKRLR